MGEGDESSVPVFPDPAIAPFPLSDDTPAGAKSAGDGVVGIFLIEIGFPLVL